MDAYTLCRINKLVLFSKTPIRFSFAFCKDFGKSSSSIKNTQTFSCKPLLGCCIFASARTKRSLPPTPPEGRGALPLRGSGDGIGISRDLKIRSINKWLFQWKKLFRKWTFFDSENVRIYLNLQLKTINNTIFYRLKRWKDLHFYFCRLWHWRPMLSLQWRLAQTLR